MKKNKLDLLIVTYQYPGSDDEHWRSYSRKIDEYLRSELGRLNVRIPPSNIDFYPGNVVFIAFGDITKPFNKIKQLVVGIPEECKTEGLSAFLTYRGRNDKRINSWAHTF